MSHENSVQKFMKLIMLDQKGFDPIVPYDVSSAYSQFAEPDHYGTCRKSWFANPIVLKTGVSKHHGYLLQACRPQGCRGMPAMAPPDCGRSVNFISTRGRQIMPTIWYWHPRIIRPSYGPVLGQGREEVFLPLWCSAWLRPMAWAGDRRAYGQMLVRVCHCLVSCVQELLLQLAVEEAVTKVMND